MIKQQVELKDNNKAKKKVLSAEREQYLINVLVQQPFRNKYQPKLSYALNSHSIFDEQLSLILQVVNHSEDQQHQGSVLELENNWIGEKGCLMLSKYSWKKLEQLNLSNNCVGDKGCHQRYNLIQFVFVFETSLYLAQGYWLKIKKLLLKNNGIGDKGSQHLTKASFNNLVVLDLDENNISKPLRRILRNTFEPQALLFFDFKEFMDQYNEFEL